MAATTLSFYMGAGDLNTGIHGYMANTSATEQPSQIIKDKVSHSPDLPHTQNVVEGDLELLILMHLPPNVRIKNRFADHQPPTAALLTQ